MKKKLFLGIFVFGMILFALVIDTQSITTLLSSDNLVKEPLNLDLSSTSHKLIDLSLIPHASIEILTDANFTDYAFLGLGTAEEPYIIENYNITTTDFKGIYINSTTKHFVIRNCYIDAHWTGIYISNVAEGTASIINNIVENTGEGIVLMYSYSAILMDNTCNQLNGNGIELWSSSDATLTNNTCNNNGWAGIELWSSSGATLTNNTISLNCYGIHLDHSSGATLTKNTCYSNNVGYGIQLAFSSDAILTDNICNDNRFGIELVSSPGGILTNNICSNSKLRFGLKLVSSPGATLTNNTCSNSHENGIDLASSSDTTLTDNTCINNNLCGIDLYLSSNIILTNNTCKNNEWGIGLDKSDSSIFTYNLLQENNEYGIFLDSDSYNNIIHHNIFIDNNLEGTSQGSDEGTNNTWYEEEIEEGNYWNDLNEEKSYLIDGSAAAIDRYPLNENLERIDYEYTLVVPALILVAILLKRKRNAYFKPNKSID